MAYRLEIAIKLIHQRNAVGNIQANNIGVGYVVQVLHQGAYGIAMCRYHHPLARPYGRCHGLIPERQNPLDGVFQAFGQWHFFGAQPGITPVVALAARIVGRQLWWWCVVAAAPDQHLRVAVFFGGFRLVQALQGAVMPLVQAPAVHHRQPGAVHLVECVPQGAGGALEHAGVGQIKVITLAFEQLAGLLGLLHAGGGQVHVGPAGEAVVQVPG